MAWRYLAQRLTGLGPSEDELIDVSLPLKNVTISDVLSGPGILQGTLEPETKRLVGSDGQPLLQRWNTAIYAESDGVIRAGAILTDPGWNGSVFSLGTLGFAGYPQGMPYTGSWKGTKVDPLDVVRRIWDHLQNQPYGNLGMKMGTLTTPIQIGTELKVATFDPFDDPDHGPTVFESGPAMLRWYETDDCGEAIDKLADETPFDYHERHEWFGDEIHHYLDFAYPGFGLRRDDLRFVIGENCAQIPEVKTAEYATEIMALGAGEGRTMLRAFANRPGAGLRRVVAVTDKSRKSQKGVERFAKAELAARTGVDTISELYVRDHPHARVGALNVGDEILVEGRTGWREVEMWCKVTAISIRPDDGDSQVLSVVRSDTLGR